MCLGAWFEPTRNKEKELEPEKFYLSQMNLFKGQGKKILGGIIKWQKASNYLIL